MRNYQAFFVCMSLLLLQSCVKQGQDSSMATPAGGFGYPDICITRDADGPLSQLTVRELKEQICCLRIYLSQYSKQQRDSEREAQRLLTIDTLTYRRLKREAALASAALYDTQMRIARFEKELLLRSKESTGLQMQGEKIQ